MLFDRRKFILVILLIFIVVCVSFILFVFIKPDTSSYIEVTGIVVSSLLGVISLFFVVSEYKRARNIEEGQFISGLNNQFINNIDLKEVFRKLYLENKNPELSEFSENDIPKIVSYLTFLETFWTMYERNILKIDMIDDLFANRFFMMITNKNVQRLRLVANYKIYHNIRKLEEVWRKYRKIKNKENLYPESSLNKAIALKVCEETFFTTVDNKKFNFLILNENNLDEVIKLQEVIINDLEDKSILYKTKIEDFYNILKDGSNISLGLKFDNKLIAYCFFTFPDKDFYVYKKRFFLYKLMRDSMYFKVVVVEKKYRRRGIHTAFLKMAQNYARNYGIKRIIATVHPNNRTSCHVFENSNFKLKKVKNVHNNEVRNIYEYKL